VAEAAIGCASGEADRLAAARQSRVEARRGEDRQREYLGQLKRLRQGRAGKALEQLSKRRERSTFLLKLQQEKMDKDRILKETVQAQGRLEGIVAGFAEQRRRVRRASPVPSSSHAGQLLWPVRGPILRGFGRQKHAEFNATVYSSGYEIGSPVGTPVRAAEPGTVVFADWLQGYGRVMIIDHGGEFYTVYGHIEDFTVTVDQVVRRGTVIATLGDTGNLGSPSLYFEVRQGARALNPRNYLGSAE
jgi:septal ring factor EnvC (AmiA/AmiB activator)